jgi:uncharacterized glyoxalase superfamily protein PhnB
MPTTLNKLTPNLMVEDVNQTIQFYRDILAFEVLATVPQEGTFAWAMLKRDNVEIMFQQRTSLTEEIPVFSGRAIGGSLTFYIDVDDIQGLYEALQGKAKVVQEMHTTFYGAQEFGIEDCNGYVLVFAQSTAG